MNQERERIKKALVETKAIISKLSKREGACSKHLRKAENLNLIVTYRAHAKRLTLMLK